ncbi:MAG TPA: ATP-grasp fold amidoligase family protein [Acetobacteraceae bacterium]|nr:ATP-grasp fold amidoligase family protein [Acetobacteraceae bacterium]
MFGNRRSSARSRGDLKGASAPPRLSALWYLRYYGSLAAKPLAGIPLWRPVEWIFGRALCEQLRFFVRQGYWPHIRRPRSFSEKVVHRKLREADPLYSVLADKWGVRDYVRSRVGEGFLNEVYCVVDNPDCLPFASLPQRFVLKATHGSRMNLLVEDAQSADGDALKRACRVFLKRNFGADANEHHYAAIPHRIVAERFLTERDRRVPLTYMFFMFHGKCHAIQVHVDQPDAQVNRFYDSKWSALPFSIEAPMGPAIEQPANLAGMIAVAEKLSDGLDFVRVDLYALDGQRIVFGEMTLTPEAGWGLFLPREWDFRLGALW